MEIKDLIVSTAESSRKDRAMWTALAETAKTVRHALGSWSRTVQFVVLLTATGLAIVGTTVGVIWAMHNLI